MCKGRNLTGLLAVLIMLFGGMIAFSANLLANGSFELTGKPLKHMLGNLRKHGMRFADEDPFLPMRWDYYGTRGSGIRTDLVNDAHSGKLALSVKVEPKSLFSMSMKVIEVLPGGAYRFGLWAKGHGKGEILIRGYAFEGSQLLSRKSINFSKDWVETQGELVIPGGTIRTISYEIRLYANSHASLDDAFFKVDSNGDFDANTVFSKKPVKDKNTLLLVNFDGEGECFLHHGASITKDGEGRFGKGVRFDRKQGSNAFIPFHLKKMPKKGTLEFWFSPDKAPEHIYNFMVLQNGTQEIMYVSAATDKKIGCRWRIDGERYGKRHSIRSPWQTSFAWLRKGNWHHIAIQWDGEAVRYYFDGVLAGINTDQPQPFYKTPDGMLLGSRHFHDCWSGLIDEIRLSDVQRYGPILPKGIEWQPINQVQLASKDAVKIDLKKIALKKKKRAVPNFQKERLGQVNKVPAPSANTVVFDANVIKPLIKDAPYFKLDLGKSIPGMNLASVNHKNHVGDPKKLGLYWKLNDIKPGKYYLGIWYESGAGAPQEVHGALYVYLNGRIVQFDRTSDSIQAKKGHYYSEALSANAVSLKPGDEIAVLPGRKRVALRVTRLTLYSDKPAPGRGWMPLRAGQSVNRRRTSLGLYVDAKFLSSEGEPVSSASRRFRQEVETDLPSSLRKTSDGKQALARCEIGNLLPVPLKVDFNAEIKSYYRKRVGEEKTTFTVPAHGTVIRDIPFDLVVASKRYTILASVKAVDPPDLGWPLDTFSYFPGLRQNLPFPDPFYAKDELALRFSLALPGSVRQEFSLNGNWKSALTTDLNPPVPAPEHLKWRNRKVPFSPWQCRVKNIKPRPHGIYLCHDFQVPEKAIVNSYQLTITNVVDEATVYVNKIKVGNVRGGNTPLTCDITKALKPGQNKIMVVVRDLLAIMNPEYVNKKNPVLSKAYLDAPGVFSRTGLGMGAVSVKSYPTVYAHDPFVVPSVQKKEISGQFELTNNSAEKKKLKVVTRILNAGNPTLDVDERELVLTPGQTELLTFSKAWNNPILWGPGNPHLYTFAVQVFDSDTNVCLDLMRERFGFRESWVQGNRLYFNGKPVNFKGSSTGGGQGLRVDDVQLSRGAKLPYFMDEFGYLASQALGSISNSPSRHNVERDQFWQAASENILNGAKRLGNHPCIIAWDLSNEWLCYLGYGGGDPMKAARRFKTLSNELQRLDPSRWTFFNGDEDLHGLHDTFSTHYMLEATHPSPISGFRFNGHSNYFPDGAFFRPLDRDFIPGEKIMINVHRKINYKYGEKVLMNTENTWKTGSYMPPGPCKFSGEDDVLSPAIDSGSGPSAWMWKQNLDGHRDLGVGALYNYTGIFGVTRRGHMLQCFIMPDHTHHYFSGSEFKRRYSLLNDLFDPATFKFKWSFIGPDGKTVEKGDDIREMNTGDLQRGEFFFKIPKVDKRAKFLLKLELFANDAFVYGEERDIEAWPVLSKVEGLDTPVSVGQPQRELFVFDPTGETSKIFTKAGIPFKATDFSDNTWNKPKGAVLIIGVDAIAKSSILPNDKINNFVSKGGRCLVLRQTKTMPALPVKTDLEPREWSSMPFVRVPQHPILRGISSWDLKFWNPGHVTAKGAYSKPMSGPAVTLIDSGNKNGLEWTQLMECYRGEGIYLLNQLLLIEDYDTEPMARELLARMIRYLAGSELYRLPVKKLLVLASPSEEVHNRLKKLNVDFKIIQLDRTIAANDVVLIDAPSLPVDFVIPKQWQDAIKQGASIVIHNAGPENKDLLAKFAGQEVILNAQPIDIWEGRAYRNGFTDLTAGLSQLDLYWKTYEKHESGSSQAEKNKYKIDNIVYWSASAPKAKEHIYPGGLLEIPVGKGRVIVDQVRWQTKHDELDTKADRYLCSLLSGLDVKINPFAETRKLPKHINYDTVNLEPFANRGFVDEVGGDGIGGWSDQGPRFDLRQFPTDAKCFRGVPFKIGKEPRSCIVLKTKSRPHPDKVPSEVTIPIDQKVEGLYFLHSSSYTRRGQNGLYQVQYSDGSVEEIPLINSVNIRDWASQPGPFSLEKVTKSQVAWTGACEGFPVICVFSMLWINPRPEMPVKSVRFSNPEKQGCPILIALTKVLKKDVDKKQLAEQRKQAETLFQQGVEAFRANEDKKAKKLLEKAIVIDPEYAPAFQTLGQVCEKLKDEKGAFACYQAWVENGAQTPLPYNRVGEILERRGDLKGALRAFKKSLEIEWNQPPIIEAKSRLQKQELKK